MNNTILSSLSKEDKNKSFVTIVKDGASFDIKLSDVLPDFTNTATGINSVTLNTTSGVAVFTENCAIAPGVIDYIINNNLVRESSYVRVSVQAAQENSYASLISVACSNGIIIISINDGALGNASAPIVTFEILN